MERVKYSKESSESVRIDYKDVTFEIKSNPNVYNMFVVSCLDKDDTSYLYDILDLVGFRDGDNYYLDTSEKELKRWYEEVIYVI